MMKAPIYDDHVERCKGPAQAAYWVASPNQQFLGSEVLFVKRADANIYAKQLASTMPGRPFVVHKVYISQ